MQQDADSRAGDGFAAFGKDWIKAMIIESWQASDTFSFGRQLGERSRPGEIYLLDGDLGTGKTVLTQGFAKGLGIEEPVNSPTFTIVQVYENGRLPFYHFDTYRIGDIEEMEEIGYEDYFYGPGVCIVEWASQIRELLPEKVHAITIEKAPEKGFDYRRITYVKPSCRRNGGHYETSGD